MAAQASDRKKLQSAWVMLRFGLREAAANHGSPLMTRISALPAEAPDPEVVAPIARHLVAELEKAAAEGEASPTVRFLKKTFRPNDAERERRNVEKEFNAYVKLWNDRKPPA